MFDGNPFLVFAEALNRIEVPYVVTGSVAATLYGEPRFTHDVDLVVELAEAHLAAFAAAFPMKDFYCPPMEVLIEESRRAERGHFNLIHHASGLKAGLFLRGRDPLHAWALAHRRTIEVDGLQVHVAPPEYVILRKLEYYREGSSEKHLGDIRAMLELTPTIDLEWLTCVANERGLSQLWALARRGTKDSGP